MLDYDPIDILSQLQRETRVFLDPSTLFAYLEEAYVRLFIATKGRLSAYLYASCYENENALMVGKSTVEMKLRLADVGLAVTKERREPPDHLCIELEYLYFLLEKGWNENQMDLIREARSFARLSMVPWISRFRERLRAETKCRFYPLSASVLLSCLHFIADPA